MKIIIKGLGKTYGKKIATRIQTMVLRQSFRWSQRVDVLFGYSASKSPTIRFEDIEARDTYKVMKLIELLKEEKVLKGVPAVSQFECSVNHIRGAKTSYLKGSKLSKSNHFIAEFFEVLS